MTFVVVDRSDVQRLIRAVDRARVLSDRDKTRAVSDARRKLRTRAIAQSSTIYQIGKRRAGQDTVATRVDPASLSFQIIGRDAPIPILARASQFSGKASRRPKGRGYGSGISVLVQKERGRSTIRSGFRGQSPQGASLFWTRTGGPKRRARSGVHKGQLREPIRPLTGPSIADMLNNPDVHKPLSALFFILVQTSFITRIERTVERG